MIGNGKHLSNRQKQDALELQQQLFTAAGYRCVFCGESLYRGIPQLAHVFGQGKHMMTKYGPGIIHHPLAMVPVERLEPCNSAIMIGDETAPGKALIARIRRINAGEEPMPSMADHYEQLRQEFKEKLSKTSASFLKED